LNHTSELKWTNQSLAFWSGDKTGKASPASCLVAWIKVCAPKDLGGLGIRDMGIQNICLLLKLLHKLHCPEASAWSAWVRARACISNLNGDIHGGHWEVLRALLPLYQAITSVKLGDGMSCSFWRDVWLDDDALADVYPALFSHCNNKDATVHEVFHSGLNLVPRLSQAATSELQLVQDVIARSELTDQPDRRITPFSKKNHGLDTGTITPSRTLLSRASCFRRRAAARSLLSRTLGWWSRSQVFSSLFPNGSPSHGWGLGLGPVVSVSLRW
jgi:hypothetical protein